MRKNAHLGTILRSPKTIFTVKDIALLWREPSSAVMRNRLQYYATQGQLIKIRQGIYAKDNHYNKLELATKILTPAYVSFETILAQSGFIFQFYQSIYIASYLTREIVCDEQTYLFRKLKTTILTNHIGIIHKDEYSMASPERAFLDTIYLNQNFYFDNLSGLNWEIAREMLTIYENKRMMRTFNRLYKEAHNV